MSKEYLEAFKIVYNNFDYLISDVVIENDDVNICLKTIKEQLPTIKQALQRLESIDNANPSEALECLESIKDALWDDDFHYQRHSKLLDTIEQALLKAQEPKQYVDELKLVEKERKALDLLMQELDCKDFADLRKYARCGYEKLNNFKGSKEVKIEIPESSLMDYNPVKQYLKWEDLEFEKEEQWLKVKMGNNFYRMDWLIDDADIKEVNLYKYITNDYLVYCACIRGTNKQFFNDLHLERVEE